MAIVECTGCGAPNEVPSAEPNTMTYFECEACGLSNEVFVEEL